MDIIYLWNLNLKEQYGCGVSLSGKYDIQFSEKENCLKIKKKKNYVRNFCGQNVVDCFAVVGENGSGKTRLVNSIMYSIRNMKNFGDSTYEYLIICEDTNVENCKLYLTYTKKFETINIQSDVEYEKSNKLFSSYEVAYFHNALSRVDYLTEERCKYDFSLGNQIKRHYRTTIEMHYDNMNIAAITNYFDNEDFRIIRFLYFFVVYNDLKIDFPVPNKIEIGIENDYFDESYIQGLAKALEKDPEEDNKFNNKLGDFFSAVDNLTRIYGETYENFIIKKLIYNLFMELCIPETIPQYRNCEYNDFFEACKILNRIDKLKKISIYECMHNIIKNLETNNKNIYIGKINQFVEWIEKNSEEIHRYITINNKLIEIPVQKSTENFMMELMKLYSNVNLQFPFLKFSFGVSTGEYYFLSLFSNLYSIAEGNMDNGFNAYDISKMDVNVKNLLLIFDEVDLSLHPRWQRMFMKWLIDFCEELYRGKAVKIIITTHSPILLSDFPGNSVLYLIKDENKSLLEYSDRRQTFGCNIHMLFLDSFFLDKCGTMGAFAEEKINEIANIIYNGKKEEINKEDLEKEIEYIGEGIIKQKLKYELGKNNSQKFTDDSSEIKLIEETISRLEKLIKNLESKLNDKN